MKKLKNLKQSILNKNIFKRIRNTININNAANSNLTANLNNKKLYDLLESTSSTYVISSSNMTTSNPTAAAQSSTMETISTSSLISKCNLKREHLGRILSSKCEYEKLSEFDAVNSAVNFSLENEDMYKIFFSYYIGNTVLSYDTGSTDGSASNFISKIIENSKQMKRKQRRVLLQISLKGFRILDCDTMECIVDASIYRISYVTLSKTQKNVYAFIYQNSNSNLIECHAFDCKSKNYAKNLLSASFLAFNLAYEKYYNEKDSVQRELMLKESNSYYHSSESKPSSSAANSTDLLSESISKQLNKLDELIYDVSIEMMGSKNMNNSLPLIKI